MSKINKFLIAIVIVLVVALLGVIYWQKGGLEGSYYAVYLSTGDIYFGKISPFSRSELNDVWLLQKDVSNPQNPYGLAKFDKAFWGPQGELDLNSKDIIWKAKLRDDSSVVQAIKNPQLQMQASSLQPLQQSQISAPSANQPTSTPKK